MHIKIQLQVYSSCGATRFLQKFFLDMAWHTYDPDICFTGGLDGIIKSWTIVDLKIQPLRILYTFSSPIYGMELSPNTLFLLTITK